MQYFGSSFSLTLSLLLKVAIIWISIFLDFQDLLILEKETSQVLKPTDLENLNWIVTYKDKWESFIFDTSLFMGNGMTQIC